MVIFHSYVVYQRVPSIFFQFPEWISGFRWYKPTISDGKISSQGASGDFSPVPRAAVDDDLVGETQIQDILYILYILYIYIYLGKL